MKMVHDLFDLDEPIISLPSHTRHPTMAANQVGISIPQWPETDLKYDEWWARGCTGEGTVFVVVDTGVAQDHSEFNGQIMAVVDGFGGDGIDRQAHGSHTFGTILCRRDGRGNVGRAFGGKGISAKGLNDQGSGSLRSLMNATRLGIEKAVELGAKDIVCSNSWGGPGSMPQYEALQHEMEEKYKVLFVGAAGNSGAGPPSSPARSMLSVGALDRTLKLAAFSQYGRVCDFGVQILSAIPGNNYARFDGTSMSTPECASAIGMLLAWERKILGDRRTWTLADLEKWLVGKTIDLGPTGDDPAYGLGIIDPNKFFDVGTTPPPPLPPPPGTKQWRIMADGLDAKVTSADQPTVTPIAA